MIIEKKTLYLKQLQNIIRFISQDKPIAALNFEKELNKKLKQILSNPKMHRKSHYFDDKNYRDLIYKGYTIIYKIENNTVKILDIFKWQER
jgi:plasmid stabilization system protein ParE